MGLRWWLQRAAGWTILLRTASLLGRRQFRAALATALGGGLLAQLAGGPAHRAVYTLLGVCRPVVRCTTGVVKPGFERVRECFERQLNEGLHHGAQAIQLPNSDSAVDLADPSSLDLDTLYPLDGARVRCL